MRAFGIVVWIALLAAVLVTGCGQGSREGREAGTAGNSSADTTQAPAPADEAAEVGATTSGVERGSPSRDRTSREAPFTAAPEADGGTQGAADSILAVTFGEHDGYERALVDFGSGGDPASQVPVWSLSSPTGEGYGRITFPGIDATSVSDGDFGGSVMDNFYVVRAPGGGMFVDVFATGAFQYRVTELSGPGRLVVDYRPTSVDLAFPLPARSEKVVLFEPRVGEAVTSPLTVGGYSRNFEASNTVMLMGPSGNVLSRGTAPSNDWLETWGYFEASLEFPAFEGSAMLRVGNQSPRDGSFEGVEVPVTYGGGRG